MKNNVGLGIEEIMKRGRYLPDWSQEGKGWKLKMDLWDNLKRKVVLEMKQVVAFDHANKIRNDVHQWNISEQFQIWNNEIEHKY